MTKKKTVRVRIAVAVSKTKFPYSCGIQEGNISEEEAISEVEHAANSRATIIEADLPIIETAVVRGRVRA